MPKIEFDGIQYPEGVRMTREHEWFLPDTDDPTRGRMGITPFAQEHLGDVVYIQLPAPETKLEQLKKMGEIESVKAVSDLFAPVSGRVSAINIALAEHPELVNQYPFGEGWMLEVEGVQKAELANLMDPPGYVEFLKGEAGH